jgi:putative holliday junction resolvase
MARILAFDYGQKRVGVAATDPLQIIANAVGTIDTKLIYPFIVDYMQREQVERFVVGYPYNDGMRENQITPHIERFIAKLTKDYPHIPISKVDESFSSRQAMETMIQSGIGRKKRQDRSRLDSISAVIILQRYMEG